MISLDTNLLFASLESSHADHSRARAFVEALAGEVAISELVLMELYVLLRNPAVTVQPLAAPRAAEVVEAFRTHPRWRLLDAPEGIMAEVWKKTASPAFARRRVFDARLGLSLVRQGVTEFATRNVSDFRDLGFTRVFDPLTRG